MNKKLFRKLSIFLSAMVVMMSVSITALATPSIGGKALDQGNITISKNGAAFTAYKVLSAKQSGDAFEYSPTESFKGFFNNPSYGNYDENKIKNLTNADDIKNFSEQLHKYVIDEKIQSGITINSDTKTKVDLGYYLVIETSESSEGDAVISTSMLVSVPEENKDQNKWQYDVKLTPKDVTPTLEKKVVNHNQKFDTSTDSIGDLIDYEVNATIPTYESNVDTKKIVYKFKDTMGKGLTYEEKLGFKITSGNTVFKPNEDYTISTAKDGDGNTSIEVTFVYDKIKPYATTGLKLEYQAILNKNAIINTSANGGNPNSVQLTYTNNPYIENSYKTLEDNVTSYTWGFGVKKVDAEDIKKDLQGAEFSVKDEHGKVLGKYSYDENGNVVELQGNGITDVNGVVTFTGLKEGDYYIHEDKAPKGYSLLKEPVKITITGIKDDNSNYTGEAKIAVTNGNAAGDIIENTTMKDGNVLFNVQIKDYEGISLPGTGGIGTLGFTKLAITLLVIASIMGVGYLALTNKKKVK